MSEQQPLFEVISEEEFKAGQAQPEPKTSKGRKTHNTDERTFVTWFRLPHHMGICTVPGHDEIIQSLKPENQEYRQKYPVRMVFTIGPYEVCRDCFMAGADLQAGTP